MKISFLNTFGAIALTGMSVSLFTPNLSAGDFRRGEPRPAMHRLPHDARAVNYRGERCWVSGGHYYRSNPLGIGFVEIDAPVIAAPVVQEDIVITHPIVDARVVVRTPVVVQKTVVEEPVVEQQVEEAPVVEESTVEEAPVLEEEDTVVEVLPEGCQVVVIGGERCWVRDGVYYRHCDHGYKVCHPKGKFHPLSHNKAVDHKPVLAHPEHEHAPHNVVNHIDHKDHFAHTTANHEHKGDKFHN
jgi:hypothetical protein